MGAAVQNLRADAGGRVRQATGIWPLMQWAFQREGAQIEVGHAALGTQLPTFGVEYVMIEQAKLGCRIDGGGRSSVHPDADLVADAVGVLPPERGGLPMAYALAEMARSGILPDCRIGARPQYEPLKWAQPSQYAPTAKTMSMGRASYEVRGRRREYEMVYCPVRVTTSVAEIAAARRRYLDAWGALAHVRDTLRIGGGLSAWQVDMSMPPMKPWEKRC